MSKTLGIILAAGRSSRLFPATLVTTKQVLPIYDKPLIFYPLTTLMLAGIREFVLISNPKEKEIFQELFRDCEERMGIKIYYGVQEYPKGIADAFNVAKHALYGRAGDYENFALILGDNIFYGATLSGLLKTAKQNRNASVFATTVQDPERFGVVEIDKAGEAVSLEEKPKIPKSNLAVTGLYFYPRDVFNLVSELKPSLRGELEITDLNKIYLREGRLSVSKLARGMVWFDTGTPESMLEASNLIQTIQNHQQLMIGSPHEVGYINGWINKDQLMLTVKQCSKTAYGNYLWSLIINET